jgi:hypothetical protein
LQLKKEKRMTIIKIITFIKSLWWHIYLGFPKSTQEQINYRFAICSKCEKFDINNSECLICGCSVNNKKIFFNKLAWSDQKCPIDKWDRIKN